MNLFEQMKQPAFTNEIIELEKKKDRYTPTCKKCGKKMVVRKKRKPKQAFWGCSSYPDCRYTEIMTSLEKFIITRIDNQIKKLWSR